MHEKNNTSITVIGKHAAETATLIWALADDLAGAYKPHEYGLVILPMTVIKRFHDCLLPTHQVVLDTYERVKSLDSKDDILKKASGYDFYNTSPFTFNDLLSDLDNIADNFRSYLNGFSDNVLDIITQMKFMDEISHMERAGLLCRVISEFCSERGNFSPEKMSAIDMGYVFENLVRRFSTSYNEKTGSHFTSSDISCLMSDLLITGDDTLYDQGEVSRTIYDMAMGTSQMLTCMEERLKRFDIDVSIFGQELNPFTFGIAKADMMIRGGDPDNMRFGDTLSDDKFKGYKFDYIISNPPFGISWKREEKKVEEEYLQGAAGRFEPGLPPKNDGQLLFMLNGLSKLKERGKMAIVQNASSLFCCDAGFGSSEIRKYLIENDWIDAIIQLPAYSFYNTSIPTYIWILTKDKPVEHRGKILLVDASKCETARRKNLGSKRVDISDACRDLIIKAYGEYKDAKYTDINEIEKEIRVKTKVMKGEDFGYQKIVVETPKTNKDGEIIFKKGKTVPDSSKRDREIVPLTENIDEYFKREILPYNPATWIDKSKTKIGYKISFTKLFYEYQPIELTDAIEKRIIDKERNLTRMLYELFGEDSN